MDVVSADNGLPEIVAPFVDFESDRPEFALFDCIGERVGPMAAQDVEEIGLWAHFASSSA